MADATVARGKPEKGSNSQSQAARREVAQRERLRRARAAHGGCCRDEGRVARDLPRDQQSPPSAERDTGRAVWRPWRRRGEARCSTTASLSAYCLLPMCAVRAAGSPGSPRSLSCRRPYHGRHPVLPGLGGRDDRGLGRDRGARAGEARVCGAAGVHVVCAPWLRRRLRPRSAG